MTNVISVQNRKLQDPEQLGGLRIRLLGPVSVEIDGVAIVIPSKRARGLLSYLVLREDSPAARIRVSQVLYDYSMSARSEAPEDSETWFRSH